MLFYVIHQEVRLLLEISSNICLVIYLLGGLKITKFHNLLPGLHTNYGLMEELVSCKKVLAKALPGAPNVCLIQYEKF